jgi:hypothetical protein
MKKSSSKLPTQIKVRIQEDGAILIYGLCDYFIEVVYKISPGKRSINYLKHI